MNWSGGILPASGSDRRSSLLQSGTGGGNHPVAVTPQGRGALPGKQQVGDRGGRRLFQAGTGAQQPVQMAVVPGGVQHLDVQQTRVQGAPAFPGPAGAAAAHLAEECPQVLARAEGLAPGGPAPGQGRGAQQPAFGVGGQIQETAQQPGQGLQGVFPVPVTGQLALQGLDPGLQGPVGAGQQPEVPGIGVELGGQVLIRGAVVRVHRYVS
jgi:hypothetical protein